MNLWQFIDAHPVFSFLVIFVFCCTLENIFQRRP